MIVLCVLVVFYATRVSVQNGQTDDLDKAQNILPVFFFSGEGELII